MPIKLLNTLLDKIKNNDCIKILLVHYHIDLLKTYDNLIAI